MGTEGAKLVLRSLADIRDDSESMLGSLGTDTFGEGLGQQSRLLIVRAKMVDRMVQAQIREDRLKRVLSDKLKTRTAKLVEVELAKINRDEYKRKQTKQ